MDHIFQFFTVLYSFSVLVEDPVLFAQTEKENVLLSTITVLGSLYSPNGGPAPLTRFKLVVLFSCNIALF